MKKSLSLILLSLLASLSILPAQEAWLLEMPNKFSDYLIKKSVEEEYDTVTGIIAKLPDLIAAKQVRELELIKWKAEEGKMNAKKKITEGTRTFFAGARYYSEDGESLEHRKITITPASPTGRTFKIDAVGVLPRAWTPTFVYRGEKLSVILLERHEESGTATVSLKNSRQLEYDAGAAKELVAWYSSAPLDTKVLSYHSHVSLIANPEVKFGSSIFTSLRKEGESVLRIEVNSQDSATPDNIVLHHNEAIFDGHAETTGPLKLETIKVADKSATAGADKGAWTLTLTAGE